MRNREVKFPVFYDNNLNEIYNLYRMMKPFLGYNQNYYILYFKILMLSQQIQPKK